MNDLKYVQLVRRPKSGWSKRLLRDLSSAFASKSRHLCRIDRKLPFVLRFSYKKVSSYDIQIFIHNHYSVDIQGVHNHYIVTLNIVTGLKLGAETPDGWNRRVHISSSAQPRQPIRRSSATFQTS